MSVIRASKAFEKHVYDQVQYGFIFDAVLPSGTTISSVYATTSATESGSSTTGLTIASAAANSSAFNDDDGNSVGIGRAVQATVSGGTADCTYAITVDVIASNGEKYGGIFPVEVYG